MENKGYKIAYNAKSSYTETRLTVSSIFFLDYMVDGINKFDDGSISYYPFFKHNQEIPLLNKLKERGYNFTIIENNWAKCKYHYQIKCIKIADRNLLDKIFNDYSLEVFFSNSFIFTLVENYNFSIKKGSFFVDGYDTIQQYKKIFIKDSKILDEGNNFIFIHHYSPHRPMRNEKCDILKGDQRMNFSYQNYDTSVQCVFKRMMEIDKLILSKFPNSIIVFQSDHGPTFEDNKDIGNSIKPNLRYIRDRINIFNAMYLPKKCQSDFNDNLGTLQTIKIILNCIGEKEFKLEKKSRSFMFFPFENPKIVNLEMLNINLD